MRTVPLGGSGAEVSALGLGGMFFGSRTDETTSFRLLDTYVEAGGSFIDTANVYAAWLPGCAGGESERLIGAWLRRRGNRAHVFLATKVGFAFPGVEPGLGARAIESECDHSLKRLGVETIDLYYAHIDDRRTPLEETMTAFDRLVRAGKVRFLGASNFTAWRLEEAAWISRLKDMAPFCCVQVQHTYLRPRPGASFLPGIAADDGMRDYSLARNLPIVAYSPLLGGAYSPGGKPLPPEYTGADSTARLTAVQSVAAAKGATPNQIVLAWMLQSVPPVVPLVGAGTVAQLLENLGALDIVLSGEDMDRLSKAGN